GRNLRITRTVGSTSGQENSGLRAQGFWQVAQRRLTKSLHRFQQTMVSMDNLRVHHSKPVKAWLAEHEDAIAVFRQAPAHS
ncbi:MAG: hypothetical protein WCA83_15640, partial [Azonexus sp.]